MGGSSSPPLSLHVDSGGVGDSSFCQRSGSTAMAWARGPGALVDLAVVKVRARSSHIARARTHPVSARRPLAPASWYADLLIYARLRRYSNSQASNDGFGSIAFARLRLSFTLSAHATTAVRLRRSGGSLLKAHKVLTEYSTHMGHDIRHFESAGGAEREGRVLIPYIKSSAACILLCVYLSDTPGALKCY